MKTKLLIGTAVVIAIGIMVAVPRIAAKEKYDREKEIHQHRVDTWISALEWCESRGYKDAVNPKDRDGTASYYSWQWKPSTFEMYGKRYGLIATSTDKTAIPDLMKDYELQRNILRKMIDDKSVNFYNEFPDCVKLKVGPPPRK